jgi:hypothetical protein
MNLNAFQVITALARSVQKDNRGPFFCGVLAIFRWQEELIADLELDLSGFWLLFTRLAGVPGGTPFRS